MKQSTKDNIKLILIGLALALALSLDVDHAIDKLLGQTVTGEPVSLIDYRYPYGQEDVGTIA